MGKRIIGRRVLSFSTLPSTMDKAGELVGQGAVEGTLVITSEQTVGRGRMGRSWLTPVGNVAMSVILYPKAEHLPKMIMISSLAVARSIEAVFKLETELKWPNDVMVNGRKIAGILIESAVKDGRVEYVIIGIGVNINMKTATYPEIADTATSLSNEMGGELSKGKLVDRLIIELDSLYSSLQENDKAVFQEWRRRLNMLGRKVRAVQGGAVTVGMAQSVNEDGSLNLVLEDGRRKKVLAGDVSLKTAE